MRARELETLEIVRERQPVAMADVAYRLNVGIPTARTYLHSLRVAGLIVPSSSGALGTLAHRATTATTTARWGSPATGH